MASTEGFLNDDTSDLSGSKRSSGQIRSEIDRTRADMDETFAALDAKLTPSQIGMEVWHLFKGGSTAGAGKLWRIAREHPMPAAVIGLGLGWLLMESSKHEDGRAADFGSYRAGYAEDFEDEEGNLLSAAKDKARDAVGTAREKVGEAADWTREHASDLGHRAKDQAQALKGKARSQARRAKTGLWRTLEENPLLVGAATLAVGVIAGLAIPETDRENELMGETRDRLFEQAKETGQQTMEKGKHVVEAVADTVKEEVKNAGLTPEGMAEKVKDVAKEAVNTAKQEARNQKLTPAAQPAAQEENEPELAEK